MRLPLVHDARRWLAAGPAAVVGALICCAVGWPCAAAPAQEAVDPRLVAPAGVGVPPPRSDPQALRAWAAEHELMLIPVEDVLVASGPRRLEGGLLLPRPSLVRTLALCFDRLAPEDIAALVAGRSLLIDRAPPEATDLLRSVAPGLLRGPSDFRGTLELGRPDRREQWEAAYQASHGRGMTDEEWQEIAAREAGDLELFRRYPELAYRQTLALSLDLMVELLDRDGKPVSDRITAFTSLADKEAEQYVDWDERSIVSLGEGGERPGSRPILDWLAGHEPRPVPVVELATGTYSLAQLVAEIAQWHPRRVLPEFGGERLHLVGGRYPAGILAEAVQRASGLAWLTDLEADDGRLVLGLSPAVLASPTTPETAGLGLIAELLSRPDAAEAPFVDLAANVAEQGDVAIEWQEVDPELQAWLLQHAQRLPDEHGTSTPPGSRPISTRQAEQCVVRLSARLVWRFSQLAEIADADGRRLYQATFSNVYWTRPGGAGG